MIKKIQNQLEVYIVMTLLLEINMIISQIHVLLDIIVKGKIIHLKIQQKIRLKLAKKK